MTLQEILEEFEGIQRTQGQEEVCETTRTDHNYVRYKDLSDIVTMFRKHLVEMDEATFCIPKERYDDLLDTEDKLLALEAGGVDNWEWYEDSLKDAGYYDEEDK